MADYKGFAKFIDTHYQQPIKRTLTKDNARRLIQGGVPSVWNQEPVANSLLASLLQGIQTRGQNLAAQAIDPQDPSTFNRLLPFILPTAGGGTVLNNLSGPLRKMVTTRELVRNPENPAQFIPQTFNTMGPASLKNLIPQLRQREYELLQRRAAGQFAKGFERIIKK